MSEQTTGREVFLLALKDFLIKVIITYAIAVSLIVLIGQVYRPVGIILAVCFVLFALFKIAVRVSALKNFLSLLLKRVPGFSFYLAMANFIHLLFALSLILYCFFLYTELFGKR
jgi:hypothetical protein